MHILSVQYVDFWLLSSGNGNSPTKISISLHNTLIYMLVLHQPVQHLGASEYPMALDLSK